MGLLTGVLGALSVPGGWGAEQVGLPMRFEHLTLEDGLSQSNVMAVLQDASGLMWFGTEDGLDSYNGYEFTHYRAQRGNPDALAGNFIFDIEEDANGNLWIATNGAGLSKLDRATGAFKTFRSEPDDPSTLPSNIIRRLLIDPDGILWLGTRGGGLVRFDPRTERFSSIQIGEGDDRDATVFALHRAADGVLWVGGDGGLARLQATPNGAALVPLDAAVSDAFSDLSVRAIAPAEGGGLWIGTYGGGLLHMRDGVLERFLHDPDDVTTLSANDVSSVLEDRDGRLWVGTTRGLNLVDQQSGAITRYTSESGDPYSLGGDDISTIYQDRAGLLWIGTKTRGISKWNPETWTYGLKPARELTVDGKSQPNITAFVEGTDGTLWIGTYGDGLNAVAPDSGAITRFRTQGEPEHWIPDDRVMSLMRDRRGRIWAGTADSGIVIIDPASGERSSYRHSADDPSSLGANGIMTMYEDSMGRVWVGTFGGGASRFDPGTGKFSRFVNDPSDPFSLSSDRVTSFAEGKDGRFWIGTDAGGLNLFDPATGRFHAYRHDPRDPSTLAADTVYSIAVDPDGTVWVGTQGGGLNRVVDASAAPARVSFENLSRGDGLANDVVYGVLIDEAGDLWLSTNYGISRYDPAAGTFTNIGRKDGLQSDEFNFGAYYKSDSGKLYFGGGHGYNAFDPAAVGEPKAPPQIVLTAFYKMGQRVSAPIAIEEGIDLGWRDDVVTFEFAAMDFAAPDSNRYMYMLEGFDRDWIDLDTRRSVTYTDLDKGRYLLRVRAASAGGAWSDAAFAMPINVAAAPWDTSWAYLSYMLMLMALGAGLWRAHRNKIRREEEYSRQLERQVMERTDALIESNEQLRALNKALQESSLSDPLTGLRNRRFVFDVISRHLDAARRRLKAEGEGALESELPELVFMMIDMDSFKPVNDTYGHSIGDRMLIELRDVLLGVCRRSDHVIRWGGDEFVVITEMSDLEQAQALAERIRSTIAEHDFVLDDDLVVRTTCSIGFATYSLHRARTDASNFDRIIRLADALMYEAKKRRDAWVGTFDWLSAAASFELDRGAAESIEAQLRAQTQGLVSILKPEDDPRAPRTAGLSG